MINNKNKSHIKTIKWRRAAGFCSVMLVAMLIAGCGKREETNAEEEVSQALLEPQSIEESNIADSPASADSNDNKSTKDNNSTKENKSTKDIKPSTENGINTENVKEIPKYSTNPFVGNNSTATKFNMKFNIQTDSGVAGITWGSDAGTDGEYYLWAFDCTRDIPRLYTSRRKGDEVWDEAYTNLDMMYPEMIMFTSVMHQVEIVVNDQTVTTYLDSVKVNETDIQTAKPIGQIGTWVMKGDYHAYFDDIFMTEGIDGSGDYLYSEDFSGKKSIFYPFLSSVRGQLYADSGYYTVLPTQGQ